MVPGYIEKSKKAWFDKSEEATFYERIELFDQAYRQFRENPYAVRYGLILDHILKNMSVVIREEELLSGAVKEIIPTEEQRAFAEQQSQEWWGDATEEEKQKRISFYYSPGWIRRRHPDFFTFGHLAFNWEILINKGLGWYRERANAALHTPPVAADPERIHFLEGALLCYDAITDFIHRYEAEAERLAEGAASAGERDRLNRLAARCRTTASGPAVTLQEALQLMWFVILVSQKVAGCGVFCFSRMDQYLLPFYRQDREEGKLTRQAALDLILDFYNKNNDIMNPADHMSQEAENTRNNLEVTYDDPNYIILGGLLEEGKTGVNDLSFLFVEAAHLLGLRNPFVVVRYHKGIDREFWRAVCAAMRDNATVVIYNDETMIPALRECGTDPEDVYDYGFYGCNDPLIPGEEGGLRQLWVTLPWPMELALNDGRSFADPGRGPENNFSLKDRLIGLMYGPFRGVDSSIDTVETMEDFLEIYRRQLRFLLLQYRDLLEGDFQREKVHCSGKLRFEDLFLNGTIDAGEGWITGGVKYHKITMQGSGFSTAADSLAAINRAVFVEKKYTLRELRDAMAADYQGYGEMHRYLRSLPKYGNDLGEADDFADRLISLFCDVVGELNRTRKGLYSYMPTISTDRDFTAQGQFLGATPDGRRAGEPVGENQSPSPGADENGVTALLNSAARIPFHRITGGPLNVMLHPSSVEKEEGLEKLMSLFRVYMDNGGMQIQLNVVGRSELVEAQKHPEQYKTLCVRVTGYSAYFVQMGKMAQEELISRTENG